MTPVWHDGPLEDLPVTERPVAWSTPRLSPGDDREARRLLARALIARLAGIDAADIRLAYDPHGAPVVDRPAGWHLSLSGRDGAALIGAARQPVAVDREPIDDAPPLWDMLTPAEAVALRGLPAAAQPVAWLRRWTIKEAHAKLVGEPRRIAPEAIATRIEGDSATASFEGVSRCWTRITATAIETVALWA